MMAKLISNIENFLTGESGTTLVEYAVMLMLIVGVCIAAINAVGGQTGSMWGSNSTQIETAIE